MRQAGLAAKSLGMAAAQLQPSSCTWLLQERCRQIGTPPRQRLQAPARIGMLLSTACQLMVETGTEGSLLTGGDSICYGALTLGPIGNGQETHQGEAICAFAKTHIAAITRHI